MKARRKLAQLCLASSISLLLLATSLQAQSSTAAPSAPPEQSTAAPKVAFVNFPEALQATAEVKGGIQKIQQFVDQKNQESDQRLEAINKLREQLNQSLLDKPADAERDLQKLEVDFRRFQEDTQSEINRRRTELFQEHSPKMVVVVNELAAEGDYDIIFAIDSDILYVDDSLNLTQQAIARYDAKYPAQ